MRVLLQRVLELLAREQPPLVLGRQEQLERVQRELLVARPLVLAQWAPVLLLMALALLVEVMFPVLPALALMKPHR